MSRILNLGVLAHVDAGKTSLTERLLFESGAITALGSVETGTTQTDTLPLEQQRGITIRAAVATFTWNGLQVNLIDTPGHPDFIAEVERSLSVLDAVILVVSSVEGVQPQTRRLARAIRSLNLPCIIFCNKIDRLGAREESLLGELRARLDWSILPLATTFDLGTRDAGVQMRTLHRDDAAIATLADHDDALLEEWIAGDGVITAAGAWAALTRATLAGAIVPVVFGSAVTGAGVPDLLDLLAMVAPETDLDEAPLSAQAFTIERDARGERIVWLRIWSGTLRSRSECYIHQPNAEPIGGGKITRLDRRTAAGIEIVQQASAGEIVRAHGLSAVKVGDVVGAAPPQEQRRFFAPVFETEVIELQSEHRHALRMALADLADQDPFISLRFDPRAGATSVRLFGDVQKEVIESTLLDQYRIPVMFSPSRVICIERPNGSGEAIEVIGGNHPFMAGIGLRVTPAASGRGVLYHRAKHSLGRTRPAFYQAIEEATIATLAEGIEGWEVTDIDIELIHVEFVDSMSTAGDFRSLAPLVLMQALVEAGTDVCEPLQRFRLDVPEQTLADAIRHLVQHRAVIAESVIEGDVAVIRGEIPAAEVPDFERQLPGMSRGEGDLDHWRHGWQPIHGDVPMRPRTDFNPLDRVEYLSRLSGRH